MTAPKRCPRCGAIQEWKCVGEGSDFNFENAFIGYMIFGKPGILGGFLGDKKNHYRCSKCGFEGDYDK